ncbi:MAG: hypothetical protein ACI9UK_001495 [Candidatus Krumholzibacteriia bacterium]|jgi:hypothetical protein
MVVELFVKQCEIASASIDHNIKPTHKRTEPEVILTRIRLNRPVHLHYWVQICEDVKCCGLREEAQQSPVRAVCRKHRTSQTRKIVAFWAKTYQRCGYSDLVIAV